MLPVCKQLVFCQLLRTYIWCSSHTWHVCSFWQQHQQQEHQKIRWHKQIVLVSLFLSLINYVKEGSFQYLFLCFQVVLSVFELLKAISCPSLVPTSHHRGPASSYSFFICSRRHYLSGGTWSAWGSNQRHSVARHCDHRPTTAINNTFKSEIKLRQSQYNNN